MIRRDWLKLFAAGGAGLTVAGSSLYGELSRFSSAADAAGLDAYFAVTTNPNELVDQLLKLSRQTPGQVQVAVRNVLPLRQDLTVIRNGEVIDPSNSNRVSGDVARLTADMRNSGLPGTFMVSMEPLSHDPDRVIFERDGRVVESIDPTAAYDRIVVAGLQGDTVFRLADGALSVVSSSCRHELCKSTGSLSSGRIICAPNRLVASIGKRRSIVDVITG